MPDPHLIRTGDGSTRELSDVSVLGPSQSTLIDSGSAGSTGSPSTTTTLISTNKINDSSQTHNTRSQSLDPYTSSVLTSTALISRPRMDTVAAAATVFPAPVANLVTALASSAKLSLRVAAFFIEAILETSQYSTRMSLGYTRRLLVTAISSARRVYLMSNAAFEGDLMGMMGLREDEDFKLRGGRTSPATTDAFLQVLDKYTNLGIYVVHHAFTMAELFTMSGFYLTTNVVQSAHYAAQGSVALFDSLFGSNESSRTLASIIELVRKEFLEDERFRSADKGKVALLTALTKALTAFACLQNATWERTAASLRMKVMYDCTILSEKNESSSKTVFDNLRPESRHFRTERVDEYNSRLSLPTTTSPSSIDLGPASSSDSFQHHDIHQHPNHHHPHTPNRNRNQKPNQNQPIDHSQRPFESDNDLEYLFELENLVGESGEELYDQPPDEALRQSRRVKRVHDDMLEITEELSESTVVTRTFQQVSTRHPLGSNHLHSRQRSAPLPDVVVEHINDELGQSGAFGSAHSFSSESGSSEFTVNSLSGVTNRQTQARARRRRSLSAVSEDDNDWIEVDQILAEAQDDENVDGLMGGDIIPTAPNGFATASSSYREALESPYGNSDRIQFMLRTMTSRVFQRKRLVKRILTEVNPPPSSSQVGEELRESSLELETGSDGAEAKTPRNRDTRRMDSQDSPGLSSPAAQMRISDLPTALASNPKLSSSNRRQQIPHQPSSTPNPVVPSTRSSGLGRFKFPFRSMNRETSTSVADENTFTSLQQATGNTIPSTLRESPLEPKSTEPGHRGKQQLYQGQNPQSPQSQQHQIHQIHQQQHRNGQGHTNSQSTTPLSEIVQTSSNRAQAASSQIVPEEGDSSSYNLYPHDELVKNIHRFMRYASAAYGQNFLRILGLGNNDFHFPSTGKYDANSWAFAQHTNIPIDNILLSSSSGSAMSLDSEHAPPLVHYITVDHKNKAIVLTCRGTLGMSDILVDLTCHYAEIKVEGGDPNANYLVHGGMYQSALRLTAKKSTVHRTLVEALKRHPTYGLVLCGHSLGGGVAALLSIISSIPASEFIKQQKQSKQGNNNGSSNESMKTTDQHPPLSTPFVTSVASGLPPGRPIHCYAFGPPAVTSIDLAKYSRGLITSVVQNSDIVPCLSLGVLRDLKNVAVTLFEEGPVAEEIVGRVVGIYRRKFAFQRSNGQNSSSFASSSTTMVKSEEDEEPTDEQIKNDWMMSLIKTMRADMDNEKLYPPGMVYILEYFDVYVFDTEVPLGSSTSKAQSKHAQRVILRQCDSVQERFREPLFCKTMLNDHLPSHYERSTQLLFEGLGYSN